MNKSILIKIIENQIKDVLIIGNQKFNVNIEFNQIEIKYNLRGTTAGKAQNLKNNTKFKLWFNLILAEENLLDFNSTIIHEIAHLYQRLLYKNSSSHGKEFHKINRMLGNLESTRCHNYDTTTIITMRKPKIKYLYRCNCGKIFKLTSNLHTKINNGQIRICKECRGKIFFTGKILLD